jgi:hypothetical protein
MKKNLCFIILISSLVLFSCKKENPATPDNTAYKLKTYTEAISGTGGPLSATYNFTYDSQNRITSMYLVSASSEKFVFTYVTDSHISMDLLSSSGNIHVEIFFKNTQLDSTYQYNDTQDTTTEKYVYNASKQLTKLYEYDYSNGDILLSNTTSYTYDSNGNVIKTEDTDKNVETFDYYPDLVNTMPVLSPLLPSRKTNLEKTHTFTSNGYPVGSATSTYTFDSSNRISTITQTTSDGSIVTKTFTYF